MLDDLIDSVPTLVAHADWSLNWRKRWMAQATLEDGRYLARAPEPVREPSTLLGRLLASSGRGTVLVGFDFPIGLPAAYARLVGERDFLELLPRLGEGEWSEFYQVAERPEEIRPHRPFYPQRPGGTSMMHLLDALGASSANDLMRRCDRGYPGRQAAAPIFWTMGAKQVGKATIAGWRDLLVPALQAPDLDLAIWPFDGELRELFKPGRAVIVETYPAEFYRHLRIRVGSKREQEDRRSNAPTLLRWADEAPVDLTPELRAIIDDGFGSLPDGEDPFDAAVGLFGMLNVVLGHRSPGEPAGPEVRHVEGWMFGQARDTAATTSDVSGARNEPSSRSEGSSEHDTPPAPATRPAEYDSLADLYDLEYAHDYDVPFWLSLAEREGGPIVEWGAGTGRLALPLAGAGFAVTGVEVSEQMVLRGREKSGAVEWVHGDMRSVKLGRRYKLAICAFNSFLCLLSVDEALAFLRNAREHLEPSGLLGIEVSAFSPGDLLDTPGGSKRQHDFTRELSDGKLDRFSVSRYDSATQLVTMRLFYELRGEDGERKEERAYDLTIRVTGRDELGLMIRLAGFEIEAVYGGFGGEAFTADSDHLIVLARNGQG